MMLYLSRSPAAACDQHCIDAKAGSTARHVGGGLVWLSREEYESDSISSCHTTGYNGYDYESLASPDEQQ